MHKSHRAANLISKCFLSRDVNSLIEAFITYMNVRSRLEYCSVAWSPSLRKDIESLEKVQRRFTKRLRGLQHLTYRQRLNKLQLKSLELRRLRLDLIFAYKLVFRLTELNLNDILKLCTEYRHRGHKYKLFLPGCSSNTRHNFFTYRTTRTWNNLPADNTDFSNLNSFKRSITSTFLASYCKVYFFSKPIVVLRYHSETFIDAYCYFIVAC